MKETVFIVKLHLLIKIISSRRAASWYSNPRRYTIPEAHYYDILRMMRLVGPIEHDAHKIVFLLLQALISPLGFFWSQDMRKHRRNFEIPRLDEIKRNFPITFNRVFDEPVRVHRITPFVCAFERDTSERIKMNVIEYRDEA